MSQIIYFKENEEGHSVIRFVGSYRKGGFLRRERITYTFYVTEAATFDDADLMAKIKKRIYKDYPMGYVDLTTLKDFIDEYYLHHFFLIAKCEGDDKYLFYAGESKHKPLWTSDINEALIGMDCETEESTKNRIRRGGDQLYIIPLYLDIINDLLNPNFMITCESKSGKKEIKYFARKEGNRLRLVATSNAAAKFPYKEVMTLYEELNARNKNFLYSVLPAFSDNVSYKRLKDYLREHPVNRAVQMELKLSHLSSANKDERNNANS